jgi:hypothetical protein
VTIDLGDTYRLNARNLSAAGDLVTATNMALTITLPDESTVVVDPVVADSTGVYHYDYLTTQAGRHLVRWVATGTGASAYVDAFDVASASPLYLVSLQDVKETLNITTSTYDEELRIYVEAATTAAEDHRDEIIAKRTLTYKNMFYGCNEVILPNRPIVSLTSVVNVQTGLSYNTAGYDLDQSTGKIRSLTGGNFVGLLRFTYVAGYAAVPPAFALAVRIIVQHLWETQRGPMGASRFAGSLDDAALMRFRSMNIFVPPRAQELLGDRMPMV